MFDKSRHLAVAFAVHLQLAEMTSVVAVARRFEQDTSVVEDLVPIVTEVEEWLTSPSQLGLTSRTFSGLPGMLRSPHPLMKADYTVSSKGRQALLR